MSCCPVCSAELTSFKTPLLSTGKLASGETVCTDCYDELYNVFNKGELRKMTLEEVKKLYTPKVEAEEKPDSEKKGNIR